ncbi:MAG: tRNA (N6-threonylcarbamoyladenosine(37)-N6)-methyltransferase TrmO [Desulfurococcaceae archaeon]
MLQPPEIVLKPIGIVRTPSSDEEVKSSYFGVDGYIEVYDEYVDGLRGLEGFSHIIVLAYLHKVPEDARKTLVVKHRRLLRFGLKLDELPETGVFATDSPHRPNPLALSILRVVKIEGKRIYVKNLDLYDGTPVLDIKPYTPDRCIEPSQLELPEWYVRLRARVREVLGMDVAI